MQSGRGAEHEAPLVLVCDDTEPIRRLLRINLELAGFRVAEAADCLLYTSDAADE